jgi:hypothetical protein
MFSYFAYGLGIHSEVAIPEFIAAEVPCDVKITIDLTAPYPTESPRDGHFIKIEPAEAFLVNQWVGKFLIRQGREVFISPLEGVNPDNLRLHIIGIVMSFVLYQRGYHVLHGSAVEVEGGAVAFIGESGWGKSSIAAALNAKGHRIIGDDVIPVLINAGTVTVVPGFPQVKIFPEVANFLGHNLDSLILLHPELEKKGLRLTDGFSQDVVPLKRIYVLSKGQSLAISPLSPQKAMLDLVQHSIPTRWSCPQDAAHFLACAQIMKHIPMFQLQRSDYLPSLPDLAQLVEDHLMPVAPLPLS